MKLLIIVIFALLSVGAICSKQSNRCISKSWTGCKVRRSGRGCVCLTANRCENPFIYSDKRTCKRHTRNYCKRRKPCQNGGMCMNIKGRKKFRCNCSGTNFYGETCNTACPVPDRRSSKFWQYPTACISV